MDFTEIEKAYAMGRAYAMGLKHAKLMAKLNSVAQDEDGFVTLTDKKGNSYVAQTNKEERERFETSGTPLSKVKKEEEKEVEKIYRGRTGRNFKNDRYDRKAKYVEQKEEDNEKIALKNGATKGQVKAIEQIGAFRHDLHSNIESIFNSESEFQEDINRMFEYDLPRLVEENHLEKFGKLEFWHDYLDLPSDYDEGVTWEDAEEEVREFAEKVDKKIIKFIQKFDEKFGTSYAPTGFARLK